MVGVSLVASLLSTTPASAGFGVVVTIPESTVYSPYGGPVTVTFSFAAGDPARVFTIRLRRPGRGTIKEKDVLVDPSSHTSPHTVGFSWKDLSVSSATGYVIDVRRQGRTAVLTSEPFTVLPKLVSDLSATPSPFYPWVDDGYRDDTTIGFRLAADTTDTVLRLYAADAYGRCCGPEIRAEDLGPLPSGAHGWVWDGKDGVGTLQPKGTYFARILATDTEDRSKVSKGLQVELSKGTIRRTATKEKHGSAYAKVSAVRVTAIGGNCNVSRDRSTHEALIRCANANVTVTWKWQLAPGERIEKVSFRIDGGYYGCHKRTGHTKTTSFLEARTPPTSTCNVSEARITYSYPYQA
jgi:hypothetical protein